jgi:hypothetical protein
MRYVRLTTTVSKIVDEDVADLKVIKSIVSVLRDKELDCTLRVSDGPKLQNVRIYRVDDDSFNCTVVTKNSCLKKSVLFADLDYLEVNTSASIISRTKPSVSRWTLLDPAAEI